MCYAGHRGVHEVSLFIITRVPCFHWTRRWFLQEGFSTLCWKQPPLPASACNNKVIHKKILSKWKCLPWLFLNFAFVPEKAEGGVDVEAWAFWRHALSSASMQRARATLVGFLFQLERASYHAYLQHGGGHVRSCSLPWENKSSSSTSISCLFKYLMKPGELFLRFPSSFRTLTIKHTTGDGQRRAREKDRGERRNVRLWRRARDHQHPFQQLLLLGQQEEKLHKVNPRLSCLVAHLLSSVASL